jgi:hypothetical protein
MQITKFVELHSLNDDDLGKFCRFLKSDTAFNRQPN